MGILCEASRWVAVYMKRTRPQSAAWLPLCQDAEESRSSRTVSRVSSRATSGEMLSRVPPGPCTDPPFRFTIVLFLYHAFCAALVAVAMGCEWVVIKGGGSFAWELWAIWQHVCLCGLFIQNVLRSYRMEANDLAASSTFVTVLLYTLPLFSELADTMKDWIVTGICLMAAPSLKGFATGCVYIISDLLLRWCVRAPNRFPFRFWPPLTMFLISAGFACIISLIVWGLWPCGSWPFRQCPRVSSSEIHAVPAQLLRLMSDGGCLFLLSGYVIIISYVKVSESEEAARDLRRVYRGILSIRPEGSKHKIDEPTDEDEEHTNDGEAQCGGSCGGCYQLRVHMRQQMDQKLADFVSSAKLLIAWTEDLPQGLIGLALTLRHRDKVGSVGFAAVSAIVSFLKGFLIPVGQGMVLARKMAQLHSIQMNDTKEIFKLLSVKSPSGLLSYQDVRDGLPDAVKEYTDMACDTLNLERAVEERPSLFAPVYEYLDGLSKSETFVGVCGEVVSKHRQTRMASMMDMRAQGFSSRACKLGGYTVKDFRKAAVLNLTVCQEAGFTADELLDAGNDSQQLLQALHCSCKDLVDKLNFLPKHFHKARIQLRDCYDVAQKSRNPHQFTDTHFREAGYSAADFRGAGLSAKDCKKAGFALAKCREAGYTAAAFYGAELSACDCKAAGFDLSECLDGGYNEKDCRMAGYKEEPASSDSDEQARTCSVM